MAGNGGTVVNEAMQLRITANKTLSFFLDRGLLLCSIDAAFMLDMRAILSFEERR